MSCRWEDMKNNILKIISFWFNFFKIKPKPHHFKYNSLSIYLFFVFNHLLNHIKQVLIQILHFLFSKVNENEMKKRMRLGWGG